MGSRGLRWTIRDAGAGHAKLACALRLPVAAPFPPPRRPLPKNLRQPGGEAFGGAGHPQAPWARLYGQRLRRNRFVHRAANRPGNGTFPRLRQLSTPAGSRLDPPHQRRPADHWRHAAMAPERAADGIQAVLQALLPGRRLMLGLRPSPAAAEKRWGPACGSGAWAWPPGCCCCDGSPATTILPLTSGRSHPRPWVQSVRAGARRRRAVPCAPLWGLINHQDVSRIYRR